MNFRPLLASPIELDELDQLKFPVLCSPKLDGIRCCIVNGQPLTRALKHIPNKYIRQKLTEFAVQFPAALYDGEIIAGNTFQETTSAVMSHDGEPVFAYWYFDKLTTWDWRDAPYHKRYACYSEDYLDHAVFHLFSCFIHSKAALLIYHQECLDRNYEGTMIRSSDGIYKFGRATKQEGILLKLKPTSDAEARVVGYEEQLHNTNPQELNELGLSKRSSCQANQVPTNKLGALVCVWGTDTFKIGTGFDDAQRIEFWRGRNLLLNKTVKFKYQKKGMKDLPRSPVFLGFRDKKDL